MYAGASNTLLYYYSTTSPHLAKAMSVCRDISNHNCNIFETAFFALRHIASLHIHKSNPSTKSLAP